MPFLQKFTNYTISLGAGHKLRCQKKPTDYLPKHDFFDIFSKLTSSKNGTFRERLKNFQSPFEEVNTDFSVAMKNLLNLSKIQKNLTIDFKVRAQEREVQFT